MKKASRSNQRDALIMIYSFNYGHYHLYFLISIPIHTVPQISTGLFYSQHAHTYSFRIRTRLYYLQRAIHMVLELVHACSICNEPIHMVSKLEQACTNLKRDSYMSPLQFIILLVRGLANIP